MIGSDIYATVAVYADPLAEGIEEGVQGEEFKIEQLDLYLHPKILLYSLQVLQEPGSLNYSISQEKKQQAFSLTVNQTIRLH